MQELKYIITELQSTSGKLDKERILKENSSNLLLQQVLKFVYDPMIISGLSSKKINKVIRLPTTYYFLSLQDCFDYLSTHNTGTDQDITNIQNFINSLHPNYQGMCVDILTKSLKLGCDVKTINKAFGNFIRVHEVQQAYPLEKYKLKPNEWISLSQKLNGIRGTYVDGKIISRQGHEIKGLEHILEDIRKLNLINLVIDGELIRKNIDNIPDNENFRITTSIVNSDSADKSEIEFVIFDIIALEDFTYGESTKKYSDRLKYLTETFNLIQHMELNNLVIVETLYSGTDHNMIEPLLKQMDDEGKEGLILNRDTKYKCKRNNGILKVKSFHHCDVFCKRIELGTGKYSNTLGSIVVDYKGFECGVGSGFADEQRDFYFRNQDEIIGKIVQVKYKEESKNKNGGVSIQFPIFECVRNDKTEPSYN